MSLLLVLFVFLFSMNTLKPARHLSFRSGHNGLGLPVILEVPFAAGAAEIEPKRTNDEQSTPYTDLERLAEQLNPGSRLAIVGFSAPTGGGAQHPATPEELSRERAQAVSRLLQGFAGEKEIHIVVGSAGSNYPKQPRHELLSSAGTDGSRDFRDKVEVCLFHDRIGDEVEW
ncbi:MAG: hypothetical protein AAF517_09855 [Planctomycetota bacterium]